MSIALAAIGVLFVGSVSAAQVGDAGPGPLRFSAGQVGSYLLLNCKVPYVTQQASLVNGVVQRTVYQGIRSHNPIAVLENASESGARLGTYTTNRFDQFETSGFDNLNARRIRQPGSVEVSSAGIATVKLQAYLEDQNPGANLLTVHIQTATGLGTGRLERDDSFVQRGAGGFVSGEVFCSAEVITACDIAERSVDILNDQRDALMERLTDADPKALATLLPKLRESGDLIPFAKKYWHDSFLSVYERTVSAGIEKLASTSPLRPLEMEKIQKRTALLKETMARRPISLSTKESTIYYIQRTKWDSKRIQDRIQGWVQAGSARQCQF